MDIIRYIYMYIFNYSYVLNFSKISDIQWYTYYILYMLVVNHWLLCFPSMTLTGQYLQVATGSAALWASWVGAPKAVTEEKESPVPLKSMANQKDDSRMMIIFSQCFGHRSEHSLPIPDWVGDLTMEICQQDGLNRQKG
jgi:hypothetical protein